MEYDRITKQAFFTGLWTKRNLVAKGDELNIIFENYISSLVCSSTQLHLHSAFESCSAILLITHTQNHFVCLR